jgi:hypothetical protein
MPRYFPPQERHRSHGANPWRSGSRPKKGAEDNLGLQVVTDAPQTLSSFQFIFPAGSMYAIYGNIYHQYTPNVSIYTIHGSYGFWSFAIEFGDITFCSPWQSMQWPVPRPRYATAKHAENVTGPMVRILKMMWRPQWTVGWYRLERKLAPK